MDSNKPSFFNKLRGSRNLAIWIPRGSRRSYGPPHQEGVEAWPVTSTDKMIYIHGMNLSVPIPDDLAERLSADGIDIERRALEALAAEEYRAGRLTNPELRRMLGFATRFELDTFLKARNIFEPYDVEDFEHDRADLKRLGL